MTSGWTLVYDFDGTLAPGYMQDQGLLGDLPLGGYAGEFWDEVNALSAREGMDGHLAYLHMLRLWGVTLGKLEHWGAQLEVYAGVKDCLASMKALGCQQYIVSSGHREMLEQSCVADLVDGIFASRFYFVERHEDSHPIWPAETVDETGKTRALFKINKGTEDVNRVMARSDRPCAWERMIYIGDGQSDIPAFALVKERGGTTIQVRRGRGFLVDKVGDNRLSYRLPLDWRAGSELRRTIEELVVDEREERTPV